MASRRKWKGKKPPSFVNPEFAEALSGGDDSLSSGRHGDHKARQLCRQVERTLNLAFAGDCGDEVLADLFVADVVPAPDCAHLLVQVIVPSGRSVAETLERLERAGPRLRSEVAAAITRKRAPELSFLPVVEGGESHE